MVWQKSITLNICIYTYICMHALVEDTKSNSICVKSSKGKQQGRCGEGELVVYTKDKVDF